MTWRDEVRSLPGVALADLPAEAALLTRVDRKYVVDPEVWAEVVAALAPALHAVEVAGQRDSRYRSVYFDTPELSSYLAAARRRPSRFKVRVREYLDTGEAAVELKVRSARGATVKHRQWLPPSSDVARLVAVEDFAARFAEVGKLAASLRPTLVTTYRRTTLVHTDGRVTVDSAVEATDAEGRTVGYGDALVVETKSMRGTTAVDRALWARGVRPARLSKYATSLAALHPDLPANRWHRTLRRHAFAA